MDYLLILLAVSMAVSGLGWIYFIYFFSIGYGFGVSALAVTMAVLFKDVITLPTALLCAVMFIFGCRLGLYLLTREKRSPEYKKILYGPDAAKKKPLPVVIMVWIFCALLYVGQVSPVAFFLANDAALKPVNELWAWIGAAMMAVGVVLAGVGSGADIPTTMALAIAIGIAIQNFPEGAIISIPLHNNGVKKRKAFLSYSFFYYS